MMQICTTIEWSGISSTTTCQYDVLMRECSLRWALVALLATSLGAVQLPVGFRLSLELTQSGKAAATQPITRTTARPVVHGRITEPFTVRWKATRTAKDTAENVLVHLYVVRIDREGEAPPPLEPRHVVLESALTMDFPTAESASGQQRFRISRPGVYLVRVETRSEADQPVGGDFEELDLVVR